MPYTFEKYIEKQKEKINNEILEKIREKDQKEREERQAREKEQKEREERNLRDAAKAVAEGNMSLESYFKM